MVAAGCKPKGCNQPRAAPWVGGNALIKVSRSARAACFMRGNAPWHCGLRARGAWHFCAIGAKMPNVLIAAYVSPGRCPGLWATIGLTARPNHLPIRRVRREYAKRYLQPAPIIYPFGAYGGLRPNHHHNPSLPFGKVHQMHRRQRGRFGAQARGTEAHGLETEA